MPLGNPLSVPEGQDPQLRSAADGRRTWISQLRISNFRCYEQAAVDAHQNPVVLFGANGAGKTNLLEAISLLAPGRGLRRARLGDVERHQGVAALPAASLGWAVSAQIETPDGRRQVGTGRAVDGKADEGNGVRDRRIVKIDGELARGQQLLAEILSIVWLTPSMDRLFSEAAAGRRRFLDRLVYGFEPSHAGRVAAYEHALRERNRLLKVQGPASGGRIGAWLDALEDQMARHGTAVAAGRRQLLKGLASACREVAGPFPRIDLAIAGNIEAWLDSMPALQVEERFRDALAVERARDAAQGRASTGPHRSDLCVHHRDKDMPASLCSTGEQKALLLAIVLAHAQLLSLDRDASPILLLDEVSAHLDEERRAALFNRIIDLRMQAWLTGTDAGLFSALEGRAQFIRIANAEISPIRPR